LALVFCPNKMFGHSRTQGIASSPPEIEPDDEQDDYFGDDSEQEGSTPEEQAEELPESHSPADNPTRNGDPPEELIAEASELCHEGAARLRSGHPQDAVRMLVHAQGLVERAIAPSSEEDYQAFLALQADIAGNLGICHRRLGELGPAVRQMQLALNHHKSRMPVLIENVAAPDLRVLMAAHLNLSSCYLESEEPAAALSNATLATELGGRLLAGAKSGDDEQIGEPEDNDFAMIAVAFHKVAEAHEGLKEWGKATFAYAQAHEVVKRSLGPKHALSKSLQGSIKTPRRSGDRYSQIATYCASIGSSTACSTVKKGKAVLPKIPQSARGKQHMKGASPVALVGYELPPGGFPNWPPEQCTKEEKEWYKSARARRSEALPLPSGVGQQEPNVNAFSVSTTRWNKKGNP